MSEIPKKDIAELPVARELGDDDFLVLNMSGKATLIKAINFMRAISDMMGGNAIPGSGDSMPDAPYNGTLYGRRNRQWIAAAADKTSINVTIPVGKWDTATRTCSLADLNITNLKDVDFGVPTPTTRANADAIANAEIIITQVEASRVIFSCTAIPAGDVAISLRFYGTVVGGDFSIDFNDDF